MYSPKADAKSRSNTYLAPFRRKAGGLNEVEETSENSITSFTISSETVSESYRTVQTQLIQLD